jgi:hypothetical protein
MPPDPAWVNIPHAVTLVGRLMLYLGSRLEPVPVEETQIIACLVALDDQLGRHAVDPPEDVAARVADAAAEEARRLVQEIVRAGYRGDRLGQTVRNLFECLGYPEEGAALSLRCGERADSPLRP